MLGTPFHSNHFHHMRNISPTKHSGSPRDIGEIAHNACKNWLHRTNSDARHDNAKRPMDESVDFSKRIPSR